MDAGSVTVPICIVADTTHPMQLLITHQPAILLHSDAATMVVSRSQPDCTHTTSLGHCN